MVAIITFSEFPCDHNYAFLCFPFRKYFLPNYPHTTRYRNKPIAAPLNHRLVGPFHLYKPIAPYKCPKTRSHRNYVKSLAIRSCNPSP